MYFAWYLHAKYEIFQFQDGNVFASPQQPVGPSTSNPHSAQAVVAQLSKEVLENYALLQKRSSELAKYQMVSVSLSVKYLPCHVDLEEQVFFASSTVSLTFESSLSLSLKVCLLYFLKNK